VRKYLYLGLLLPLVPAWAAADSVRTVYRIATVAGSASLGDGGPAVDAQIGVIQGVAADRAGNVYLSDTNHNCVRRIDAQGIITTVAGTGTAGFNGDGGPATSAQLNLPYGLAVDASGNLYIADLNNNRVRRVSPSGAIDTYAGSGGNGSSGDGGAATQAQLLSPRNLAIDSGGNLYIAEFAAHRVRKVAPGGTITTVAGTGIAGFRGDGGPGTVAQLAFPAGLALDAAGNLYIADSGNQRVREVVGNGAIVTAAGGSTAATLITPLAVAIDAAGDLLVADATTEVYEATVSGKWLTAAGTSSAGFYGDGGPATAALLTQPLDLAADGNGNLYIADQHRVRRIAVKGTITTVAGADYLYGIGDGGAATAAELSMPSAVALDAAGDLYIADTGTNRVRRAQASGGIETVAGNGMGAPGGEATPAVSTSLMTPGAVALDPFGNLLVVETGAHRVRQVTADGLIRTVAGTGKAGLGPDSLTPAETELSAPRGVCLDRFGNLYIVDTGNSRVLLAPAQGMVLTAAGNGAQGFAGDAGPAPIAQLNQPTACALDSAGDLYIADTQNHRIRKVDATGAIRTVAGNGIAGNGGDEGPATAAGLQAPRGIAVDDNGDLYIADTGNNAIRQVTPDGTIHTIAGTGWAEYSGDGGPALSAALNGPGGILLDGSGDLYFADTGNNRVRVLTPVPATATPAAAPPAPLAVMNAASLSTGPVAPGEAVTVFGEGLGPAAGVSAITDTASQLAGSLADTQVFFDGVAAPIFYAQANQINAQAPYTLAGKTSVNVQVNYRNAAVNSTVLSVAAAAPGVFPTAINQDGSYNSMGNPALSGSYLTIYATGEGLTDGANLTGWPAAAPYAHPLQPVRVTVSGVAAEIAWAGCAPGLVGILQINWILPGPYLPSGGAPLELWVGSFAAPLVTVWVQ
jgi:uncharacterized protein (TIGR03437 family)